MGDITHSATAAVPVDVAFAYVDNYRNVPKWMFGVSKFEPVGELDQGLGAVFNTSITLGPTTLHIRTEVTEFEQDRLIALTSRKGLESTVNLQFAPDGESKTTLTMSIGYKLPGGIAGKALGKIIDAFVGPGLRYTESHLRREIEHFGQSGSVGRSA